MGQRGRLAKGCLAQELLLGETELHQVATESPNSSEPVCLWLPPQVSSGQPLSTVCDGVWAAL